MANKQFPGAPVGRALTVNRMGNLPFRFQNQANEEGLNWAQLLRQSTKNWNWALELP